MFRSGILFIFFLNLIFNSLLFADVPFEIAFKTIKYNTTLGVDGLTGRTLWLLENYWGAGADGLIGLFNNLYLRIEFFEIRKYEYTKEIQWVIFSNLRLDIQYLIPITDRIKPLLFLGTKYGAYDYRYPADTIYGITNREYHFGFGLVYNLGHKSKIIFENQIYSYTKWFFEAYSGYESMCAEAWAFERLSLGFRYTLGDLIK